MAPRPPLTSRSVAIILLRYLGAIIGFIVGALTGIALYVSYDSTTAHVGGVVIALFGTLVFFAATVKLGRDLSVERLEHTDEFLRPRLRPRSVYDVEDDADKNASPSDHGSETDPPEAA